MGGSFLLDKVINLLLFRRWATSLPTRCIRFPYSFQCRGAPTLTSNMIACWRPTRSDPTQSRDSFVDSQMVTFESQFLQPTSTVRDLRMKYRQNNLCLNLRVDIWSDLCWETRVKCKVHLFPNPTATQKSLVWRNKSFVFIPSVAQQLTAWSTSLLITLDSWGYEISWLSIYRFKRSTYLTWSVFIYGGSEGL